MPRRILFAIRSKLGDTLISYACVRAYADANPDHHVSLLTRAAYAGLLRDESGIRVIAFNSRIEMFIKLMWLRWSEPGFDVLAVLWGSGTPIRRIGQWVNARRKIAWSKRLAPELFEEGILPPDPLLIEPAASVIAAFDAAWVLPQRLHIPSLAARYRAGLNPGGARRAIGIVPIADELRRNFDLATLTKLIAQVQRRHPGDPIRIFINPVNEGAETLVHQRFPDIVRVCRFSRLDDLVEQYMELQAWYGTDTGLYHLAASIGIPATVFFGPTQPHKIVMLHQPVTEWIRLNVLGQKHCDEKTCTKPLCLHQAVATFCGATASSTVDETPTACPLRAIDPVRLAQLQATHGRPINRNARS